MQLLLSILITNLILFFNIAQKDNSSLSVIISNDLEIPQEATLEISYLDKNLSTSHKLAIVGRVIRFNKYLKEPVLANLLLRWKDKKSIKIHFLLPVDTGKILINANRKVSFDFNHHNELFKDFSTLNEQISSLRKLSESRIKSVNFENRDMTKVQKEIDSIETYYDNIIDNDIYKKIIDSRKDSFLGVYALINYAERPYIHQRRKFQTDSLLDIYSSFSEGMKKLPTMQILHKLLLSEKAFNQAAFFPVLKLKDTLNQLKDLNKYYGNKYTLVDFWANWCTPCRVEHPNMIIEYKKYKAKGFTILSISIDKVADKHLWLEAINKDGISLWPHFIDFDEAAKKQLNIRFIPSNFLVDSMGNIIAKDLKGDGLTSKLAELFKGQN